MQQDHQALLGLLFQAILSALNLTHRYLFKCLHIRTEVNAYLFVIRQNYVEIIESILKER